MKVVMFFKKKLVTKEKEYTINLCVSRDAGKFKFYESALRLSGMITVIINFII